MSRLKMQRAIMAGLALAVASTSVAAVGLESSSFSNWSQVKLYDDPRIVRWSQMYVDGKPDDLAREIEQDLSSTTPHPFSPQIWVTIKDNQGKLKQAWDQARNSKVGQRLGPFPEIKLMVAEGRLRELLHRYPADRAEEIDDPWALLELMNAAAGLDLGSEEFLYLRSAAQRFPNWFPAALQVYAGKALDYEDLRTELRSLISPGQPHSLADTPFGKYCFALLTFRPVDHIAELHAVDQWLQSYPLDSHASARKSKLLQNNFRYEEALAAANEEFQHYPFFYNHNTIPVLLIRLGRMEEARRTIAVQQRIHRSQNKDRDVLTERQLIAVLIEAGERGRARAELDQALKKFGDDAKLLRTYAQLEFDSERMDIALAYAKRALAADPSAQDIQTLWLQILRRASPNEETQLEWGRLSVSLENKPLQFVMEGSAILSAGADVDGRIMLLERMNRLSPQSEWLKRELALAYAEGRQKPKAIALVRESLSREFHPWMGSKLLQWLGEQGDEAAVTRELESLTKTNPWSKELWTEAANRIKGDNTKNQKIDLWRRAIEANPNQSWPLEVYIEVLLEQERDDDALTFLQAAVAGKHYSPDSLLDILLYKPWLVAARSNRTTPQSDLLTVAEHDLEEYRIGGGNLSSYYYNKARLLTLRGANIEAAHAALSYAMLNPDSRTMFIWLLNNHLSSLGFPRVARIGHTMVERDPYDAARLKKLYHAHARWGGSCIVALSLIDQIKTHMPNHYDNDAREHEGECHGRFGDYREHYRISYGRANDLSNSDRYVSWYESARHRALSEESGPIVDFDYRTMTATMGYPTGEVVIRRDHPISGRPLLLKRGAAAIEAEYDQDGNNLLSVRSGARRVGLSYSRSSYTGTTLQDDIERITTSDGTKVEFRYNQNHKPVWISVEGVGELTVEYAKDGSIAKVDSSAGRNIALRITRTFQELLDLIRPFQANQLTKIPHIEYQDRTLEGLRSASRKPTKCNATPCVHRLEAQTAVVRYLIDHLADDPDHNEEARSLIEEIHGAAGSKKSSIEAKRIEAENIYLLARLLQQTNPQGLSLEEYQSWARQKDWLRNEAVRTKDKGLSRWVKQVDGITLALAKPARWFPKSDLAISGFWWRYSADDLLPASVRSATLNHVTIRGNGHLVVGTTEGLLVRQRGYWELYRFDEKLGRFTRQAPERRSATSEILSIEESESEDRTLWLGTANGLVRMAGAYDGPVVLTRTTEQGLPTPRIARVATVGDEVWLGTPKGLRRLIASKAKIDTPIAALVNASITQLKVYPSNKPGQAPMVVVASSEGLFASKDGGDHWFTREPVADAVWSEALKQFWWLKGRQVFTSLWSETKPEPPRQAPDQEAIEVAKDLQGLTLLPINRTTMAVSVLTDVGISFFSDGHFEHMELPLEAQRLGIRTGPHASASRGEQVALLTHEGLYVHEKEQTFVQKGIYVHDILSDDTAQVTYVAAGDNGIYIVDHRDVRQGLQLLLSGYSTHLQKDPEGRLVANDGNAILRFDKGSRHPQELFTASPTLPDDIKSSPISLSSLLVARDGTIWATIGPSVFRWNNGQLEEFSIYKDSAKFPARSDRISRIVETVDGKIWIVASDEGHRSYHGLTLSGGLLEWNGASFTRLHRTGDVYWFMTGYTPIDGNSAIVGTVNGFAQHQKGQYVPYADLHDITYNRLREKTPLLWLGTRGARLDRDSWLFGTAGGVILYTAGTWLYPDRLNQMLPDDHALGQYGARAVHAVATDAHGRIYAGTDRGLLIYDSQGSSASFLVANRLETEAFALQQAERFREEADVVLRSIKPGSKQAAILREISEVQHSKQQVESALRTSIVSSDENPLLDAQESGTRVESGTGKIPQKPAARLSDQLRELKKKHATLLAQLERENPSLHQVLRLDPLDLVAVQKELHEGQIVVQYLPTKDTLYIHLVTPRRAWLREVQVSKEDLDKQAMTVAKAMGNREASEDDVYLNGIDALYTASLDETLAWLYDHLLGPVGDELAGKTVLVVPTGRLSYVPFAALIRTVQSKREYAVERFTIGYISSLYSLNLAIKTDNHVIHDGLIMADPDGSLPSARHEAKAVRELTKSTLTERVGPEASYENFIGQAEDVSLIHLATHATLDSDAPEHSYLLLANGYRLEIGDIMSLDLKKTGLVVLSACETSLGKKGLEYATLARAFTTAHAPSIVATLWPVKSRKTSVLMKAFYEHLLQGEDRMTALAMAQRDMIKLGGAYQHPQAWAGFIALGKP